MPHPENYSTPPRAKEVFTIPPTPALQSLGLGTGVNVWSYRDPTVNSPWAVKSVRSAMVASPRKRVQALIDREASVLADIKHENIIGFRGFLQAPDGRNCLAMEQGGRSLGDAIEVQSTVGKPLIPECILRVVLDVAKALDYLHTEKKLLHGDIKSFNILVDEMITTAKLCDLGVCVKLNEDGTAAGNYIGTTIYNAPEVLDEMSDDPPPVTGKAEIFSLGLVIWEMVCLTPPHLDGLEDSMASNLTNDSVSSLDSTMFPEGTLGTRPPFPSQLGPRYGKVHDLFLACTEHDPDDRPSAALIVDMILTDHQCKTWLGLG